MKKLSLLVIMLISISAFSQQKGQYHKGANSDMTPEETATLQTKKLTLHLDLNEAQQQEIKNLYQEKAEKRSTLMAERKKMSAEDLEKLKENRFKRMNARLDNQLAHQEKMKLVLNEEQFKKWQDSRSKMKKSHYKSKRSHK